MKNNQKIGLKKRAVEPLRSRFFLSTGTDDPSPPRCAPGHVEPLRSRFVGQPGPTLVPGVEPGPKAHMNRDIMGVCPLVQSSKIIAPLLSRKTIPATVAS